MSDVQLDAWVMYSRMNFTDRDGSPTYRVSDFYYSTILNTDPNSNVDRNYMYLAKNNIATEDNYLYPFDYDQTGTYFEVGK